MFFIKKLILGLAAVILIYIGGSGTQSSNLLLQGGGFIGIIVGFVVLYLFGKMVWRAMGCLPVLLIICLIVGFILYAIGAFNGGINQVIPNVLNFMGAGHNTIGMSERQAAASAQIPATENKQQEQPALQPSSPDPSQPNNIPSPTAPLLSENFDDVEMAMQGSAAPQPNIPNEAVSASQQTEESGFSKLLNSLTGGAASEPAQAVAFNPNNYPAISGVARVINGDTLELRGRYFKLYGVDAPESNQTCADGRGRAYRCGQEAARWLKSWISGHELNCHVIQQDSKGNMVGTCSLGQYDIGAALVNAGWAVANTKQIDIYVPYERQAQKNGYGLWQGQFYKPWDWREIQSKKPKIKVIKPKTAKKSILDF